MIYTDFTVTGDRLAEVGLDKSMRSQLDRIRKAVRKIGHGNESSVKKDKLSGQVLHRRTGRLSAGVHTVFAESADSVSAHTGIGKGLEYGRAHELGFRGIVKVPAHTRLGHAVRAHERNVNMPVRSFLRSTLRERAASNLALLKAELGVKA